MELFTAVGEEMGDIVLGPPGTTPADLGTQPPHLRQFKDPQTAPEDAPAADRPAALLGRTIST
ncbi:hypothetical protein ACFWR9_35925 [Streptomyces sp. NPDC058534]|uniref:hypothetical protein n=1 Tax=Streptomyces sp. NPDC058534 TaxID=3346541 RepID=UPI003661D891